MIRGAALSAKASVEKIVGKPIYPAMAPTTKRSHKRKAVTQNPLEEAPQKVSRVSGFLMANRRRAEEKLDRMRAANHPDVEVQQAKVDEMHRAHVQWARVLLER